MSIPEEYRPPSPEKIRALARVVQPTMEQLRKAQARDAVKMDGMSAGPERSQRQLQRADGWANVMTGLGGPMDKRMYSFFADYPIITDPELERMYFGDGLAARIVDVVADDMTREWIKLEAEDDEGTTEEDALETIGDVLQDIDAQSIFNEALKWKRLYGGSIIVMGVLDGQSLDQPLNVNRISGFDYLRVIDRSDIDLFQSIYQNDPAKPGFGQPELLYCYFQVGVVRYPKLVHISRCCVFKGKKIPTGATPTTTLAQRFWGLSIFNGLYDVLSDYNSAMSSAIIALQEFSIGKFKMSGLADMMAEGKENLVQTRMQLIQTMKSVLHGIMLDADNEDYTRDTMTLTGIDSIIDRAANRISAASGIPVTRLWGEAPGGLSTDDESGRKTYYDGVRSAQMTELMPPLRKLLTVIQAWKKTKTDIKIEFNPLMTLDEVEESTVKMNEQTARTSKATEYGTYMFNGVLSPEQVFAFEWAEKLEGIVVESFGPTKEELAEELTQELALKAQAELQAAAGSGEGQKASQSAPAGGVSSKPLAGKAGLPTGPNGGSDPVGEGKA